MKHIKLHSFLTFVKRESALDIHGLEGEIWTVKGKGAHKLLDLKPYLNGFYNLEEAAKLSGVPLIFTEKIINYLKNLNLVVEIEGMPDPLFVETEERKKQQIFLERYIRTSPSTSIIESISMASVSIVGNEDETLESIVECLQHIDIHNVEIVKDIEKVKENTTIVIVVDFAQGPLLFKKANKILSQRKIPWLRVSTFNDVLSIGPLFIPGETACYKCYEMRFLGNSISPEHHIPLYNDQFQNGYGPAEKTIGSLKFILQGYVSLEVYKFLTQKIPCEVVGNEYTINLSTLESELNPLLKVPMCEQCSNKRAPLESLFINDKFERGKVY